MPSNVAYSLTSFFRYFWFNDHVVQVKAKGRLWNCIPQIHRDALNKDESLD